MNPCKRNPSRLLNIQIPNFDIPKLLVREGLDSILWKFHSIFSMLLFSSQIQFLVTAEGWIVERVHHLSDLLWTQLCSYALIVAD